MLKELKKQHHITYLTLDDGSAEPGALEKASEYANEIIRIEHVSAAKFSAKFYSELLRNLLSPLPYALQKYLSSGMRRAIEKHVAGSEVDIVVCDFLAPAVNVPSLPVPTLLFQHNVEAMIWQRHFEVERNPLKKYFLKSQWRRMFEYEKQACHEFDRVVAVSVDDAETMSREYGAKNVTPVATGVDTEFFTRTTDAERDPFNIVFTGSMDWLPNEDAIQWFTTEILPQIRTRVPEVTLTVVGRNPYSSLTELSRRDPSIIVTGRVPDVRPYMDNASLYIVPIRIGGGTRLKIYEAMAMRLPIVSTTIGAEGLSVTDGVNILLRDDPNSFAAAVSDMLLNREAADAIAGRAEDEVRNNNGWANVSEDFAKNCELTIKQHSKKSASRTPESIGRQGLKGGYSNTSS
jgi:glycosyltransferase involved in cell wall biosynthesis